MSQFYEALGISKQSFYQKLQRKTIQLEEIEQLIPLIHKERKDHPRMSARDIYLKLKPSFIGRDRFEKVCMEMGLRVGRLKNYHKTTNSLGVTRFPNLIKDKECTGVNQVFVSDITYYSLGSDVYYITLIMDLYNREIVGWSVGKDLRTETTTIPALHRLITQRGKSNLSGSILHSDGGGQYYCKEFLLLTKDLEMRNSMTEEDVYENAHAERLNGIVKNNYLYPWNPRTLNHLRTMLDRAVYNYNNGKPHKALNKLTPVMYKTAIDIEDKSKINHPISTAKQIKSNNKKVNVF